MNALYVLNARDTVDTAVSSMPQWYVFMPHTLGLAGVLLSSDCIHYRF